MYLVSLRQQRVDVASSVVSFAAAKPYIRKTRTNIQSRDFRATRLAGRLCSARSLVRRRGPVQPALARNGLKAFSGLARTDRWFRRSPEKEANMTKPSVASGKTRDVRHQAPLHGQKKWSAKVTRAAMRSTWKMASSNCAVPAASLLSLKQSAEASRKRKTSPFHSALSMLTFTSTGRAPIFRRNAGKSCRTRRMSCVRHLDGSATSRADAHFQKNATNLPKSARQHDGLNPLPRLRKGIGGNARTYSNLREN